MHRSELSNIDALISFLDDLQRSAIIDDSPLSQIDMTASNGVIHVLDKVLLPKEF